MKLANFENKNDLSSDEANRYLINKFSPLEKLKKKRVKFSPNNNSSVLR